MNDKNEYYYRLTYTDSKDQKKLILTVSYNFENLQRKKKQLLSNNDYNVLTRAQGKEREK